jgi:iron-sulfur cluster assembly protein
MIAPIKITSLAVEEIINIRKTKGIPQEYLLRVSIKGGQGCSGVNFTLGFDKKKELDTVSLVSGIKVLIQKSEMMFLIGKEIDFHEGVDARGFIFRNYEDNSTTAR